MISENSVPIYSDRKLSISEFLMETATRIQSLLSEYNKHLFILDKSDVIEKSIHSHRTLYDFTKRETAAYGRGLLIMKNWFEFNLGLIDPRGKEVTPEIRGILDVILDRDHKEVESAQYFSERYKKKKKEEKEKIKSLKEKEI